MSKRFRQDLAAFIPIGYGAELIQELGGHSEAEARVDIVDAVQAHAVGVILHETVRGIREVIDSHTDSYRHSQILGYLRPDTIDWETSRAVRQSGMTEYGFVVEIEVSRHKILELWEKPKVNQAPVMENSKPNQVNVPPDMGRAPATASGSVYLPQSNKIVKRRPTPKDIKVVLTWLDGTFRSANPLANSDRAGGAARKKFPHLDLNHRHTFRPLIWNKRDPAKWRKPGFQNQN